MTFKSFLPGNWTVPCLGRDKIATFCCLLHRGVGREGLNERKDGRRFRRQNPRHEIKDALRYYAKIRNLPNGEQTIIESLGRLSDVVDRLIFERRTEDLTMPERSSLTLMRPTASLLPGYKQALEQGWSPDNLDPQRRRLEHLSEINANPEKFLASFDDPEGKGEPITLLDGSKVKRLPSIGRWMWDGEFCGHIGLRWQPGTTDLPATCSGHVGYSVVASKQRRGYATEALSLILAEARKRLPFIYITVSPDNVASQKVVQANGGYAVASLERPKSLGGGLSLRFRIDL